MMYCLFILFAILSADSTRAAGQGVEINLPSCTMIVTRDGQALTSFPVRIGNRDMPTPAGHGKIVEKRKRVVFRYLEGDMEGEIIRRSHIRPTGKTIDMPYDRLRGLNIVFDGGNKSLVIHSTTEYWTIGFPVSHSCIGMDIDDMLTLFDLLTDMPVNISITYNTVELHNNIIRFYPDVYGQATNRLSEVQACGVTITDMVSAQNRISTIDRKLRLILNKALADVRTGRDARPLRSQLSISMPVNEFLAPYQQNARIVDITILGNDSFVTALIRGGLSLRAATTLSDTIKGLNYRRLQPGDSITLTIEGGEVTKLDYAGRQGSKTYNLNGNQLRMSGAM